MLKNRKIFQFLIPLNIVAIICLGFVVLLHFTFGIPFSELTRDPVQLLNGRMHHGFLSQMGMILWSGTAGICFFMVLLKIDEKIKERGTILFPNCISFNHNIID